MPWEYQIAGGKFLNPNGVPQGIGYSGQPPYINDASSEHLAGLGPIPEGNWLATSVEFETAKHGPFVIVLTPGNEETLVKVKEMGRDPESFRIHGERKDPPAGFASDGCIILPKDVRKTFVSSDDYRINVVRGGFSGGLI